MAKKIFSVGDKVELETDPSYRGTVTKTKYVPKKGLSFGGFQWLWLDNSEYPAGFTSEQFKLQNDHGKESNHSNTH